ncbi:MAG: PAS domain S-box protein, partial [candidate division Zixibacteria bacterium]|nr:PAS domain S-box protein [candidate division Zixibacteria bacterium]
MTFHRVQIRFSIYIGAIICLLLAGIFKLQSVEHDRVTRLMGQRKLDKEALIDELITLRGEPLRALALDYSWWGEMIEFVERPTHDWASENIDAGLGTYRADAGWVFDSLGHTVYVGTNDNQTALRADTTVARKIAESARHTWFGHYFVWSSAGLVEIRTAPIQPSSDSARISRPRGYFAAGRVWTPEYVDGIAHVAGVKLALLPAPLSPNATSDTSAILSGGTASYSKTLEGADHAAVSTLLCDLRSEFQDNLAITLEAEDKYIWIFGIGFAALLGLTLFLVMNLPIGEMMRNTSDAIPEDVESPVSGQSRLRRFRKLLRAFYTRQAELLAEIADRRRAESELKQIEQRYRIVAEQTDQVLYDWNVKTGTIHWAGAIEELTGNTLFEFADVDINRWEELIHPNDRADALEVLDAAAKGDGKYACEYRFQRRDGTYVYVEDVGRFLKDDHGLAYRMLGAVKDISERRRADETRRLDESRLETLLKLNQMIDLPEITIVRFAMEQAVQLTRSKIGYIAQVSPDEQTFTILAWSNSAMKECAMMDKSPQFRVEGECLLSRSVVDRRATIVDDYASTTLPKKGIPIGHVQLTRYAAVPIFDGQRIVMVAAVGNKDNSYDESDTRQLNLLVSGLWSILRRKQAEQKLLSSENRYRAIFETAGDAIFLMTGDTFVDCNTRTLEMFGCTRSEIVGQPPYRFSPEYQPDGRSSADKAIDKINAALAGQPQFFEWVHSKHDGTLFEAEVSLNRFEVSEQIMILAVVRDISDRKQAERELHKARMLLDAAVAQSPSAVLIATA